MHTGQVQTLPASVTQAAPLEQLAVELLRSKPGEEDLLKEEEKVMSLIISLHLPFTSWSREACSSRDFMFMAGTASREPG